MILIVEHDNSLTVPIDAVLSFEDKDHVAVRSPMAASSGERSSWVTETATRMIVEIKQGLEPGEQVALKPIELISEDEKRQRGIGVPTKPAARKGADLNRAPGIAEGSIAIHQLARLAFPLPPRIHFLDRGTLRARNHDMVASTIDWDEIAPDA